MTTRFTKAIATAAVATLLAFGMAQPTTISYWSLFTGGDKQFMDDMVAAFQAENPDIVIEPLTATWDNYYDFLTTSMAGGNAPDVAIIHMTFIPGFASQGTLYPLDEAIESLGIPADDFLPIPWERSTYEGVQYAIPLDVHPLALFYNKSVLADAGLLDAEGAFVQPVDRQGWLEVFETIKTETDAIPYPIATLGTPIYREWFSVLHQNGGQILSDDGTSAAFNSAEGLDALRFWIDHVRTHAYSPDGVTIPQTFTMFQELDSAIEGYGVWRTGAYEGVAELDFEVGTYPVFGDQPAMWANSHVFVLPAQTTRDAEKDRAALQFIDWMTNNTLMWTRAGHVPPRISVIESEAYQALPHRPFNDPSLLDAVRYPPLHANLNEIEAAILEELQAAVGGVKSAERALSDAERRVNTILSR